MIHLKGSAYITFCLQLKDVNARLLFNLFCSLCGAMFHPQFERSHRRAPYSIVFYRGLPGSHTECGRRSGRLRRPSGLTPLTRHGHVDLRFPQMRWGAPYAEQASAANHFTLRTFQIKHHKIQTG